MSLHGLYSFENSAYRKKLFSPLKDRGFVPEKQSQIFVSGIPNRATVHELAAFFEKAGELFQVKLMTKPDGMTNRGFAYVTYFDKSTAQGALVTLKTQCFQNKILSMQISLDNCRIFISGIPTDKSKDEIWHAMINFYNVRNIADVLVYKNYLDPGRSRGFAFFEFKTHEEASYFRAKYWDKLVLFGKRLMVDWALPVLEVDESKMDNVKILFLRNLDVTIHSEAFARQIRSLVSNSSDIEKIYKFKDYAYIHLASRPIAEALMEKLKKMYCNTLVEIHFAKPPNKYTDKMFRDRTLAQRRCSAIHPKTAIFPSRPPPPPRRANSNSFSETTSTESLYNYYSSPPSPQLDFVRQLSENRLQYLEAQNTLMKQQLEVAGWALKNRSGMDVFAPPSPIPALHSASYPILPQAPVNYAPSPSPSPTAYVPRDYTLRPPQGSYAVPPSTGAGLAGVYGVAPSMVPNQTGMNEGPDLEGMVTRMVNRLLEE